MQRAGVPIAYSQGFTPHPKISYASASPTGVASEAEYLEIALRERAEPAQVARALNAALSPGLDVLEAVEARGASLADRMEASLWRIELPGVADEAAAAAAEQFLACTEVMVERMTKQGRRSFDARAAVMTLELVTVAHPPSGVGEGGCAILESVVRQLTPAVRPDDVLAGLRLVAGLEPAAPPRVTRLCQGPLSGQAEIGDPLLPDHDGTAEAEETAVGASPA